VSLTLVSWVERQKDILKPPFLIFSPFNDDQISVIAYENGLDRSPYLLIRLINTEGGGAWFSMRGFHELCIEREGSSLILKRWSRTAHTSKNWAILNFKTWEGLYMRAWTRHTIDGSLMTLCRTRTFVLHVPGTQSSE
jgi:hypothetical protein